MIDRLRFLLDRPLDPRAGRAILVLASAILVGFAGLFGLAADKSGPMSSPEARPPAVSSPAPLAPDKEGMAVQRPPLSRQDPQDKRGSAPARRAAHALRLHRALQHVPYRSAGVVINLVGARGQTAVLRVSAATIRVARRGWHHFLRRYRDSGKAYLPIFDARGRRDG
jgi:hypothetical protein